MRDLDFVYFSIKLSFIYLMFYNYTIFRLMRCLHVNRNLRTLYCLSKRGPNYLPVYIPPLPPTQYKINIWHPTVNLMCRIPHRHSGEWKTRAIHFTFYFTCSPEHKRTGYVYNWKRWDMWLIFFNWYFSFYWNNLPITCLLKVKYMHDWCTVYIYIISEF
jgi:hypothetical protein